MYMEFAAPKVFGASLAPLGRDNTEVSNDNF
jgi:hypothetical protein